MYRQVLESVIVPLIQGQRGRKVKCHDMANLILMNEMDLKALMLLCLQFHFVIVHYDAFAVQLSAITQEDWNFYF